MSRWVSHATFFLQSPLIFTRAWAPESMERLFTLPSKEPSRNLSAMWDPALVSSPCSRGTEMPLAVTENRQESLKCLFYAVNIQKSVQLDFLGGGHRK